MNRVFSVLILLLVWASSAYSQVFKLPTANQSMFKLEGQDDYFCPTIGRTWESGTFGCVRSSGWQMHEGIDVRSIARDKNGEATDPVLATADGVVVYLNSKPGLSNYGNYAVVRHNIQGFEIYSLYAHLARFRPGLKVGDAVKAGEAIAVMGRTTNTREQISKERAHLHFELNLFINERFSTWHKKYYTGKNDHGLWNGQNMLGLDPRLALLASYREGKNFNLLRWIQSGPELFRVQVRAANFPWIRRYSALVERKASSARDGIAGYELVLNYNGLPIKATPLSAKEMKSRNKFHLISVNSAEYQKNPCRKLITQKKGKWELGESGIRLLDLLTN